MTPVPTKRGDTFRISRSEYAQRPELDHNFNVVTGDSTSVLLRLDYPGAGIAAGFTAEQLHEFARQFDLMFGRTKSADFDRFSLITVLALGALVAFMAVAPVR